MTKKVPFQPLVRRPTHEDLLRTCGVTCQIVTVGGVVTAVSAHVIPLVWPETRSFWGQLFGSVTVAVALVPGGMFVSDWQLWRYQTRVRIEGRMIKQRSDNGDSIRPQVNLVVKDGAGNGKRASFDSKVNVTVWAHLADYLSSPDYRGSAPSRRPIDAYIKAQTGGKFTVSPTLWKRIAVELRKAKRLGEGQHIKDMSARQRVEIIRHCQLLVSLATGEQRPSLAAVERSDHATRAVFETGPDRTSVNQALGGRNWLPTLGLALVLLVSAVSFFWLIDTSEAVMELTPFVELIEADSWDCEPLADADGAICAYELRDGE